jgi:hypothetical protein
VTEADSTSTAGSTYAELIKELLNAEDMRRASLESRAVTVISVSGTLVTLLLALATATATKDKSSLPTNAQGVLVAAVLFFVAAAVAAIATYAPRGYAPYDVPALTAELEQSWQESADWALRKGTAERLQQLNDLQRGNNTRGNFLVVAVASQVVAVLLVAISVTLALTK